MEQKEYKKSWKKSESKPKIEYKSKRGKMAPLMGDEAKSTYYRESIANRLS